MKVLPREPTEAMRVKAVEAVAIQRKPEVDRLRVEKETPGWCVHALYSSREADEVWRAMFDAALPATQGGER